MSQLKISDWLEQGLALLATEGIEALTIDAMCQKLGVTKGSFYHHFKNRQAYLKAILEYWEEEYTSRFISYSQQGISKEEQIERLNQLVVKAFGGNEVYIRSWAQVDPLAREFQERVDQRRINYLYELHKNWLADEKEAYAMAQLTYSSLIGSQTIMPRLTKDEFKIMTQLLGHFILTRSKQENQA